jgi:hypothetical protein
MVPTRDQGQPLARWDSGRVTGTAVVSYYKSSLNWTELRERQNFDPRIPQLRDSTPFRGQWHGKCGLSLRASPCWDC